MDSGYTALVSRPRSSTCPGSIPSAYVRPAASLGDRTETEASSALSRTSVASSTSSPAALAFSLGLPPPTAPVVPRARNASVSDIWHVAPGYAALGHAAFVRSLTLPQTTVAEPTRAEEEPVAEAPKKKKRRSKASIAGHKRRVQERAERRMAERRLAEAEEGLSSGV